MKGKGKGIHAPGFQDYFLSNKENESQCERL
jgi:hypothetical protein